MIPRPWLANAAIAFALFLLNFGLNTPLFMQGDMPYRDSIEAGYASMARFVTAHPNPWGWNPTQYCGLPVQFVYVPLLPYAAALASHVTGAPPEYLYRLITASMVCLGPSTLFLFVVYFTRSRMWALAAALAYTFFSPLYGMARQIDKDRGGIAQIPWRLQVFAKYGEGPHNTGLTLMPLALAAAWAAATGGRYRRVFLAAVLLAAIALSNFVAALATGVCCLLMMACGVATERASDFRAWRMWAAAGLGWLLACFWLTPSFIETVFFNWPKDAFGYVAGERQAFSAAGLAVTLLAVRYALLRARRTCYTCLVTLAAVVFGWIVLGHYWFAVSLIPESRRYAVEFELFLILALVEWLRLAWGRKDRRARWAAAAAAGALVLAGAPQARKYVAQSHRNLRHPWPLEATVEYPLAKWLDAQPMNGRVFASGGLRFRLNSWSDVPQVGGGFESGLANRVPVDLYYQIRTGKADFGRGAIDLLTQLKALGVEYVVVHGPKSREHYRDFTNPRRFAEALRAVYHIEDDTVYRMPVASLAHLVAPRELPAWHRPPHLDAYAAAIDDPARPKLSTRWRGTDVLEIAGPIQDGRVVSVQVNWDAGWAAFQDGRRLPVEKDRMGFVLLRPAASAASRIELRYEGTLEPRLMAGLSAAAWLAALAGLFVGRGGKGAERLAVGRQEGDSQTA